MPRTNVSRRSSTAAKFPRQSSVHKTIKKIYRKKVPATKTARNKTAIMKLSRQVKTLQNQRVGEAQTHTQWATLTGTNRPLANQPILFGLNSFYDQDIYAGQVNTARDSDLLPSRQPCPADLPLRP